MKVADIMVQDPVTLSPSHHLRRAEEEMSAGGIRHLPIVDEAGRLVGLITERDLLQLSAGGNPRIGDVMRTDIKTGTTQMAAHEAAYLMLRHAIGCVPITDDDGALLGIVTDTDFVRIAYSKLGGRVPVDEIESEEREAERV